MNKLMIPLFTLMMAGTAVAQTNPGAAAPAATSRAAIRQEVRSQEMDALVARLGLDASAAANLRTTFARYGAQVAPLRKDARVTRHALKEELKSGSPDQGRVSSLTAQLMNDRAQLRTIQSARLEAVKAQLTPTQFAQLIVSRREMGRQFRGDMRRAMHGQGKAGWQPEE
jgi:Heavy-metal resistance